MASAVITLSDSDDERPSSPGTATASAEILHTTPLNLTNIIGGTLGTTPVSGRQTLVNRVNGKLTAPGQQLRSSHGGRLDKGNVENRLPTGMPTHLEPLSSTSTRSHSLHLQQQQQVLPNAYNGTMRMKSLAEIRKGAPFTVDLASRNKQRAHDDRYTFEAYETVRARDTVTVKPNVLFRCQYADCRRVISGAVSFSCHLWAHVVVHKDYDSMQKKLEKEWNQTQKGPHGDRLYFEGICDVARLSQCPQCLKRFSSPADMGTHYTRCHSRLPCAVTRSSCAICENEEPNMANHLRIHPEFEGPYRCIINHCTYRCTVRLHLWDHYVRQHTHANVLMCPFCLHTQSVSMGRRKRPVIRVSDFVSHMQRHEMVKHHECDCCALKFMTANELALHQRKDHSIMERDELGNVRRRDKETRTRAKGRLVGNSERSVTQCGKCTAGGGGRRRKCLECLEKTFNRVHKDKVLHGATVRNGVDQRLTTGTMLKCEACGFSTWNGCRLATHFAYCCSAKKIIVEENSGDKHDQDTDSREPISKEEEMEMDIFVPRSIVRQKLSSAERDGKAVVHDDFASIGEELITRSTGEDAVISFQLAFAARRPFEESMKMYNAMVKAQEGEE